MRRDSLTRASLAVAAWRFARASTAAPTPSSSPTRRRRCQINLHVRNLPIYDYREALRPSTRISPAEHEDFEEEN